MTKSESVIFPDITKRQSEAFFFIAACISEHSYSPTQKEIAVYLGLNANTAWSYTAPLQKKGLICVEEGVGKRKLRISELGKLALESKDKILITKGEKYDPRT